MQDKEQLRDREFDESWKKVLEHYFWSFLDFYFPEIASQIDRTLGYSFLDQELSAVTRKADTQKRRLDKLAKVYLQNRQEIWLLIHVEVQTYHDPEFALRMMQYHYRIYDIYAKPVASLAILADDNEKFRPNSFQTQAFGETFLRFHFKVSKILDWKGKEAELAADPNPFAVVTLASMATYKTDIEKRFIEKYNLTKMLYERGYSGEMIFLFYEFLDGIMVLPERLEKIYLENIVRYEEEQKMPYITSAERIGIEKGIERGIEKGIERGIEKGIERGRKEGIEQGIEQGIERGRKEGIQRGIERGIEQGIEALLEVRFGAEGLKNMDEIRTVRNLDRLNRIFLLAKTAPSLEAFEDEMGKQ